MNEPIRINPVASLAVVHPKVLAALKIMRNEFCNDLDMDDLHQQVNMSKRGLEKAFQKALGRSPASEMRRMRLEYAKKMLVQTD